MTIRAVYLILALLGLVIPYAHFLPWLASNGFHPGLLLAELYATNAGAFFASDVLVTLVINADSSKSEDGEATNSPTLYFFQ